MMKCDNAIMIQRTIMQQLTYTHYIITSLSHYRIIALSHCSIIPNKKKVLT